MSPEAIALITGAIGAAIKMYLDYRKARDEKERADRAEERSHELELIQVKSDAAIRATIVGIERHKKTLTAEEQRRLAASIQEAAVEESAEDHLNSRVLEVTKRRGTRYYKAVSEEDK